LYRCTQCGAELEIFSDEDKVLCYTCGVMVFREKQSPCIEWCVSARECAVINENRKKEV